MALLDPVVGEEILRLNRGGELRAPLNLAAVAEPLSALDGPIAFEVLGGLLEGAANIDDPTEWVCVAAMAIVESQPFSPVNDQEEVEAEEDCDAFPPTKVRRTGFPSPAMSNHVPVPPTRPPPAAAEGKCSGRAVASEVLKMVLSADSQYAVPGGKCKSKGKDKGPFLSVGVPQRLEAPIGKGKGCVIAKGKEDCKGKGKAKWRRKHDMCSHFLNGFCSSGGDCINAHSEQEREAGMAIQLARLNRQLANYKTSLCKWFSQGECSRGDDCTFAHGEDDLHGFDGANAPKTPPEDTRPFSPGKEAGSAESEEDTESQMCPAAPLTPT